MSYRVEFGQRTAGGREHQVVTLGNADGSALAEVWPSLGCNCLRWQVGGLHLLYHSPEWVTNPVPTRSGVPVLFPFPNRIAGGRFSWDGREYSVPLAPGTPNAIHGFVCRRPWRVMSHNAAGDAASVTAEFQGSVDAPETLAYWFTDYRIALTVELRADRLAFVARIENPDTKPLPWGLGYHPYFTAADETRVSSPASVLWELHDSIPTGRRVPVDAAHDLRTPRRFAELNLDSLYTDFGPATELFRQGVVEHVGVGRVEVWADPEYRELVAFTPPHRQAVCLEPYTCANDAVNLQARGIEAGWRVLQPGQS
ncbi:MAG: aldose 1-epimerase, partial [Gemmataceae bacterium]